MAQIILILMSLLAAGFVGVRVATLLKIPHSVFLVILGVFSGLIIKTHGSSEFGDLTLPTLISQHFSDVIIYIFLPTLIFEAAFHLDFDHLKEDLTSIAMLSIVGLVISTLLVGYGLHFLFPLPLLACLTFGALISATDPIAVVALFKEIGAPTRLTTLIEGESLMNDGTAMVLFRLLLGASIGASSRLELVYHGALAFILVSVGSVLFGLVIATLASFSLRLVKLSGAAQLGITLIAAYISFIVSDVYLHLSGVISTLVVGLYLGKRARLEFNKQALQSVNQIWEFFALSGNTLVFFAVGLSLNPNALLRNLTFIPLTLAIVYFARAISILGTVFLLNKSNHSKPISYAFQAVLIWGGLRGSLALGLALTLPISFPHRDLFLALTFSVVIVTLIINALTTKKVISLLHLSDLSHLDEELLAFSFGTLQTEMQLKLKRFCENNLLSPSVLEDYFNKVISMSSIPAKSNSNQSPAHSNKQLSIHFEEVSLLSQERQIYEARLEDGTLSKSAYLFLIRSIEARLETFKLFGLEGLRENPISFDFSLNWSEKMYFRLRSKWADRLHKRLVIHLEILLHLHSALSVLITKARDLLVKSIHESWSLQTRNELQSFYQVYSHYAAAAQAQVISHAAYGISKQRLARLSGASIISPLVFVSLNEKIEEIHNRTSLLSKQLLRPSAAYLLGRIPFFQKIPKVTLRKLAEISTVKVISPGNMLVTKGENRKSMFVIVAGVLNLACNKNGRNFDKRLISGDYFGFRSLLLSEAQAYTVTAEVTSEALEITSSHLEAILIDYPLLRKNLADPTFIKDTIE